jgi:hypothetical protein
VYAMNKELGNSSRAWTRSFLRSLGLGMDIALSYRAAMRTASASW